MGAVHFRSEPGDRRPQPLVERGNRPPSQMFSGKRDVGTPAARIVDRQRPTDDRATLDPVIASTTLDQVADAELVRVAEIDRPGSGRRGPSAPTGPSTRSST